jgi:hydrogenase expression/formation protein HypC
MCLAVPGQILSIQGEDLERTGKVSFGGVVKEVNLACVPEARVGDYVVVHVGFALSRPVRPARRERARGPRPAARPVPRRLSVCLPAAGAI